MSLRIDLHTHTWRCKHATGDCSDYAAAAAAAGVTILGCSDHTPLPDDRWPEPRMRMDQLDDYVAAVQAARDEHPELTVLLGMECEWDDCFAAFYRDELLGRRGFDYLIGACHYFPDEGDWFGVYKHCTRPRHLRRYVDLAIATMQSGCFLFLAHPDLFGCAVDTWDADCDAAARDIADAAAALDVPLELNGYGVRKPWRDDEHGGRRPMYPWRPFWRHVAEAGATVVRNSDAHRPQDVGYDAELHHDFIAQYSLRECDIAQRLASARIPRES